MLRRYPLTLLALILFVSGNLSCSKASFTGQTPDKRMIVKPAQTVVPTGNIGFACTLVTKEANLGNELPDGVPVFTPRSCADSMEVTGQILAKRPLDLVFVLDVTLSMQPSIDTVKENIVAFTQLIGAKGWDARFAAVAFRDSPGSTPGHFNDPRYELLYNTTFMTAEAIRAEISSGRSEWIANDISDNQEGGQSGIAKALDVLNSGRRLGSEAAILYVSDAPAFKDKDHWNFTVNDLASRMAAVSKMRFFHSTLAIDHYKYEDLPSDGPWVGDTSYRIAKNQMEDLRRLAGKDGVWLPFPLDKATFLDSFSKQFDSVSNTLELQCDLVEAKISDKSGQTVAGFISKNPLGEALGNDALKLEKGIGATGQFTYFERRCCVRRVAGISGTKCEKMREGNTTVMIR